METLIHFLSIILYLIQGCFFYKSVCCAIRPLDSLPGKLLAWLLLSMAGSVRLFAGDPVNIIGTLGLFLATVFLLFRGQWFVKLGIVMIFYPIVAAFNFLHNSLGANIFFSFSDDMGMKNYLFSVLAQVILILFWYLFHRFMGERLSRTCGMLDQRSWMLLTVICLASLTAVISLISFQLSSAVEPVVYLCMAACIVTNFGTICLATRLADTILADMERRNLRLQKSYYEELDQNQQQIRKIRHDMNNHLSVVEELLKKGDIQNALEYFENLAGHVRTGTRRFCKDSIVNAVLNAKYNAAEDASVDSFFHVDIDEILGIDPISLCTIFSNTLDNAIEACRKIPEREKRRISLKARYTENGYFSCEIVNSKKNAIRKKKDAFLTDKEDARSHGLGIASIRDVIRRYDGTLDISYTEEEFRVVVLIKTK